MLPTPHSATPFCHGLRTLIRTDLIPLAWPPLSLPTNNQFPTDGDAAQTPLRVICCQSPDALRAVASQGLPVLHAHNSRPSRPASWVILIANLQQIAVLLNQHGTAPC